MKKEIFVLSLMNFCSVLAYSIIAPLFPLLGTKNNIDEETIGLIISIYTLTDLFTAPFLPKIIKKVGRIRILYIARFLEATCIIIYGLLHFIESTRILLIIIFSVRLIHGITSCCIITLTYSLVNSISEEDKVQTSIGYIEIGGSLGGEIGPLCASFFYYLGGFYLPFIVIGFLLYASCYLTKILEPSIKKIMKKEEKEENKNNFSFCKILLHLKLFILLSICLFNYLSETFYFPSLTNHLMNNYGLSTSMSGVFFIIPETTYFLTLQVIEKISNKIGLYFSMFIGAVLSSLGCLFIFPVFFPMKVVYVILGLIFLGISTAPGNVISLVLVGKEIKNISHNIDESSINDIASAMYMVFIAIGEGSGPIIGGFLSSRFGFNYSCLYIGILICSFAFVFLLYNIRTICKEIREIRKTKKPPLKETFLELKTQVEKTNAAEEKKTELDEEQLEKIEEELKEQTFKVRYKKKEEEK